MLNAPLGINGLTYRDSDVQNLEVLTSNSFHKIRTSNNLMFGSLDGSGILIPYRKELSNTLNRKEKLSENLKP